jgi:uncharacterized phiE125 gp8 family phage protein
MIKFISNTVTSLPDYSTVINQDTEVKPFLRVDGSDDDDLIQVISDAVCSLIEGYCGISIGTQTRRAIVVADEEFRLSFPPIHSVTTAKLYDTTTETYSETLEAGEEYRITGTNDVEFKPITSGQLEIVYITGFTASGTVTNGIPPALKLAILSEIAYRYQNRGDASGNVSANTKTLLGQFMRKYGI